MNKYSFKPSKIFNADETGVSVVHENKFKVLASKGKKQVGKLTSGERGKTITVLLCVNASGDQFIPPLFIFPRKKINDRLRIGAPEGAVFAAQENGWINGFIFEKWLAAFIKLTHPTNAEPVLLIVDGHSSHKEYAVIQMARKNNVHMLSLPPHSTHKMQPLDRTIMGPFKNMFSEQCSLWMRKNHFQRITEFEIAGLVNHAFTKICRMDLAKSGFECSGIHPINPNIFTDIDFLGSKGLDIDLPLQSTSHLPKQDFEPEKVNMTREESPEKETNGSYSEPQGGESSTVKYTLPKLSKSPNLPQTFPVLVKEKNDFRKILTEISPLPTALENRIKTRKRRAGKSQILTSTPVKNKIE